jgi:lysine-N-methylase
MPDSGKVFRTLPLLERWDCHTCGVCCRGHTVLLDDDDLVKIREQRWEERPEFAGVPVIRRLGLFSSQWIVAQRSDGACVFLSEDNRCRIHSEFGEPAKPWACRMFPYQILPVDGEVRVTMRRTCPSAAANKGRPLAAQLDSVRELAPKALPDGPTSPPEIVSGRRRDWRATRALTDRIEVMLADESRPLLLRLLRGARLVQAVAEARTRKLDDDQWEAFLKLVEKSAGDEAESFLRERKEPSGAGKLVFRQAASEYVRFHPNLGDRPALFARAGLLVAAVRIALGRGKLPRIHPDFPETTFAELEQPLGALPEAVVAPLARYFASMAASLQYCGAGRFGWSVVDGFRALALAYPVAMWTLRWLARGRAPTEADAVQTLVILDRSHYYPLLAGYRHRQRLRILAGLSDLERLIVWYSR